MNLRCLLVCWLLVAAAFGASPAPRAVEQWDCFDVAFDGPKDGNPFVDVELKARFTHAGETLLVAGFYDGSGVYRIRFMPSAVGEWSFVTSSNRPELDGKTGAFTSTPPSSRNHGPVRVRNQFHFAYEDGAPYKPVGTTCYAWVHQGDALEEQTLQTLASAPFNKIRFCVFPKRYEWNQNEPVHYPFEGTPNHWDFTRFNPEFFQHFEKRLGQLRDLGIEADLILFHPYDRGAWGFDKMEARADDRYLRYVAARFSAYRNVWWSLANEFDFMRNKTTADWDRFFQIVQQSDPYNHLRSIHNGSRFYNHAQPWVTHVSVQNGSAVEEPGRAELYRDVWGKPVVYDEVKYEGNIPSRWGHITAEEMVLRCWNGTVAGTYVGHGETYLDPKDILWWSKGGVLHGQSPARIAFLKKILDDAPAGGIDPVDKWQDVRTAGKAGEYYLIYFGRDTPASWTFSLPKAALSDGLHFAVDVLDTWNMTITPVDGDFVTKKQTNYDFADENGRAVKLPGTPYMALRITRRK